MPWPALRFPAFLELLWRPPASWSVITIYMHGGKVIHDSTLIDAPDDFTLDLDVSDVSYVDTGSGGHLGVFTDFLYTEAPDLDAQTPLAIHFFHLNSDGTVVQPAGWNHDRCRVLLAAVNFYKLGVNVTAANLDVTSLIVNITETLTVSGRDLAHVNMWNVLNYHAEASYLAYLADDYRFDNIFKKEFIFQDLSKR